MVVQVSGVDAEFAELRRALVNFESQAVRVMRAAAIVVIEQMFLGTPVWSGETVRNYAVGVGQLPVGGSRGFINNGEEGNTNQGGKGPLGPENRRAANEAAALSDARATLVSYKSLKDSLFITNLVDDGKWAIVDGGDAPTTKLARYPGGVALLGEQRARAKLVDFE